MRRGTDSVMLSMVISVSLMIGVGVAVAQSPTPAQPPATEPAPALDVPYVPTPEPVVHRMLQMAGVRKGDVVYDLGCGDGRIVIAAVRDFGAARGVGVDLDPQRIEESNANARAAGVSERVQFLNADLFTIDLTEADVVAMYLLPSVNLELRPTMLALRPGTRVVSHAFDMDDWEPDAHERLAASGGQDVYLWIVPAKVQGHWTWDLPMPSGRERIELKLEQEFQKVTGRAEGGGREYRVEELKLRGDELSFSLVPSSSPAQAGAMRYRGRVDGQVIRGLVFTKDQGKEARGGPPGADGRLGVEWIARRVAPAPAATRQRDAGGWSD